MADKKKEAAEKETTFDGCYGEQVVYSDLNKFLADAFIANNMGEDSGSERFATCIWGHSGIGKTALIKQHCSKPVEWKGKRYPGYKVIDVPLAQFEEMGDLHGMPSRHVLMTKENGHGPVERWVPEEVIQGYLEDNWKMQHQAGCRTMYAPPDWVPTEPGPTILLLDDWNRASVRIIKGCMQLLQNYGMVSWSLPPGCNIVLTANPDEQEYLVTSLDSAILTRMRSITLKHDAKEWSVWATGARIDPRIISYVLQYPEMMIGRERTNPRTLTEVGRSVKHITNLSNKSNMQRFKMMTSSLLDDETVTSIIVFMERDVNLVIEPESILRGDSSIPGAVSNLMNGKEKRVDVLGVIVDRLYAHMAQPETTPTKTVVRNFQDFLLLKDIPEDMRHNVCARIVKQQDERMNEWVLDNKMLTKLISEVI